MADLLIKGLALPKKGEVMKLYLCSDGDVGYDDDGKPYKTTAVEVSADRDTPMLIPKKDIHVDEFYCPNCGEELTIYCHVWQRYCPMCGQRIYEANNG